MAARPTTSRRGVTINLLAIALGWQMVVQNSSAFQPHSDPLRQINKTNQAAKAYAAVADSAVACLVRNDLSSFKKRLSPRMLERLGFAPMEASLKDRILPFFADYRGAGKTIAISQTQDIFGQTGFAVYKTLVAKDGTEKPFIVYVVSEKNRLVIANILVNKTYQEMNQGRHPQ
jgi:hypothetical protein